MLTSNRSDFRPYTRRASVTISNRRVRTLMHGGVAGVGGQPPPLCRSSHFIGMWFFALRRGSGPDSDKTVSQNLSGFGPSKRKTILEDAGSDRRSHNGRSGNQLFESGAFLSEGLISPKSSWNGSSR